VVTCSDTRAPRRRARAAQVTSPCASTRAGFLRGNNALMDERKRPGCSRWYARVLQPGWVRVGDAARLLRAPTPA
jgi:MOSC domain-containing protein YiiM